MKELNATVTLTYVEEDNKQRVIFRAIPLCTKEGATFNVETFPDEGSLRIVPDKREQSTFKERMRSINGLCTIQLNGDGKEFIKVRPNRNYAQGSKEINQQAIYSDVICEFQSNACFEIINTEKPFPTPITPNVLLMKDKVLYGPVSSEELENTEIDSLRPFGNDCFLLHTVEHASIGKHIIYWNPEATLNWRQHKQNLRKRDRTESPATRVIAAENMPIVSKETQATPPKEIQLDTATVTPQAPVVQTPPPQEPEVDSPLPVGQHLEILDKEASFEQHISRLAQPLSKTANRLDVSQVVPVEEPQTAPVHFSGTPLVPTNVPMKKTLPRPEPVERVVERQILKYQQEANGLLSPVTNPLEQLKYLLSELWQDSTLRERARTIVSENESFMSDMRLILQQNGMSLQTKVAASEQLAEIEAERISLLMQLEQAQKHEQEYRQNALKSINKKRMEESDKLRREMDSLANKQKKLAHAVQMLSQQSADMAKKFFSQHVHCMSGIAQNHIMLAPIMGKLQTSAQLIEAVRVHLSHHGYHLIADDCLCLLATMAGNDAMIICGKSLQDAKRFVTVLMESLGLTSCTAVLGDDTSVEFISLLPEDTQRTPTISIQSLGSEKMSVYGHKTFFVADHQTIGDPQHFGSYPVIHAPTMHSVTETLDQADSTVIAHPISLASLVQFVNEKSPLLDEAEKWFLQLKATLKEEKIDLSDAQIDVMQQFVQMVCRKVCGGFITAADMAVTLWILPLLMDQHYRGTSLGQFFASLPTVAKILRLH